MKTKKKVVKKKWCPWPDEYCVNRMKLRDLEQSLIKEIKKEANSISPKSTIYFNEGYEILRGYFYGKVVNSDGWEIKPNYNSNALYTIISITNGYTLQVVPPKGKGQILDIDLDSFNDNRLSTLAGLLDTLQSGEVYVYGKPDNKTKD
jgi:hypothetical protein